MSGYRQKQFNSALPLSNLNRDIILQKHKNNEELSAEEYLILVHVLSKDVPDLMTSEVNPSDFFDNVTLSADDLGRSSSLNSPALPAKEWTETIISEFKQLRGMIQWWDDKINSREVAFPAPKYPPPRFADVASWRKYTLGIDDVKDEKRTTRFVWFKDDESESASEVMEPDDDSDSIGDQLALSEDEDDVSLDAENGANDYLTEKAVLGPIPPLVSSLLCYDQVMIIRLLSRLTTFYSDKFNEVKSSNAVGKGSTTDVEMEGHDEVVIFSIAECSWIYGLLSRLEIPLVGSTASLIRRLFLLVSEERDRIYKLLCDIRTHSSSLVVNSTLAPDKLEATVASLNIIAVICGNFFAQALPNET